jgi:NusA-like KH domain protein
MVKTISMEDMRHLNLFDKVTKVKTRFCFKYNNILVFCVPDSLISKAVGDDGKNIHRMREILKKRIRIVPIPRDIRDANRFIENIVSPVTFKNMEINNDEIIISANRQNKAALIGREKRRLKEMQEIVRDFFERDFRIV